MTIQHTPWCREHQTDYEGEHCFTGGFEFGPANPPSERFPEGTGSRGDLWASQQLGRDDEPVVVLEYKGGGNSIELEVEDLLPLRKALDGLLEVFGLQVIA